MSGEGAGCRAFAHGARACEPVMAVDLLAAAELRAADREVLRAVALRDAAPARKRVPCGARTRKGYPYRSFSRPGRRRCKFHVGKPAGARAAVSGLACVPSSTFGTRSSDPAAQLPLRAVTATAGAWVPELPVIEVRPARAFLMAGNGAGTR